MNNFGIKVNLSEVFNWNVKEIFLYMTAEYKTELNVRKLLVVILLVAILVSSGFSSHVAITKPSAIAGYLDQQPIVQLFNCSTPNMVVFHLKVTNISYIAELTMVSIDF